MNMKPMPPSEKPAMEKGDWRTQLPRDSRQRIMNKILDTLKKHLPISGDEGLNELRKIALRFEEKIFTAASSQADYLRRISLKMIQMECKSQNPAQSSGKYSSVHDPASIDAAEQTGLAIGDNWQEEVYQKEADCEEGSDYHKAAYQEETNIMNMKPMHNSSEKPAMETGDWRTQLTSASRERIVNKILDILKRHLPWSGEEGLNELRKIAVRFEEKMFTAASTQMDYLRRIASKMILMERKSQKPSQNSGKYSSLHDPGSQSQNIPNDMASTGVESSTGLSSDSTQIPVPNVVGENPSKLTNISDSLQIPTWQPEPTNIFQESFSKQQQQQQALLKLKQQQQMPQASSLLLQPQHLLNQKNQLYLSQQTANMSLTSADAAELTGHAVGDDWQEEVYQKIQAMKEKYLPELNEMHQKIAAKLHQLYYSFPQPPKTEQLDKLKIFKTMVEHVVAFLSVSKSHILPTHKEKIDSYEKQIKNFINTNKPRKPDDYQMNPQLQPMMPQGFEPTPVTPQIPTMQLKLQQQLQIQFQQELQQQSQRLLHQMLEQHRHELLQPRQTDDTDYVNMRQGIGFNPGAPQENLTNGQHIVYPLEQYSKCLFHVPIFPSTSTVVTRSLNTPVNGMPKPPSLAGLKNANDAHGNATDFGKSNVIEQPHDPRVTMAKPMSLKSLSTSVVTMVDEAAAAVGEDLAAMRKRGLQARNFIRQTGLSGAEKTRCYMSAIVTLFLICWCIFFLNHQY
ncbi:hypothetical protein PTKIN_Ptkin13bG0140500 [Pterospermum kingtungense]